MPRIPAGWATLFAVPVIALSATAVAALRTDPQVQPPESEEPEDAVDLIVPDVVPEPEVTPATICMGDEACLARRWIQVDLGKLQIEGLEGKSDWFWYDYPAAMRKVTPDELLHESEESMVVRTLISEIGGERMIASRNGLMEAIAILYTVAHRQDPYYSNPEGIPDYIGYKGCEPGRRYAECANAVEYLGLGTWRGLHPDRHRDKATLQAAADLAIVAWNLQRYGIVEDWTEGSTSFVHRCGGVAYGMGTYHCDGTLDFGVKDVPGAHPNKGPAVFKTLTTYDRHGFYDLRETVSVHYDRIPDDEAAPVDAITAWIRPQEPIVEDLASMCRTPELRGIGVAGLSARE